MRPFATRLPGTVLSSTQQLVSSNLAPIFSFYTKTQLDAVVLFESSNYIQPVDSQVLLQRCIDFILDNPDQLEAVVPRTAAADTYKSADVIDVFSDDDDIELLGAVSSFENNLTNKSQSCKTTSSDQENVTGPYTDDLPVLSSPRRKRPEGSSRDEITISDSPSQNCISVSSTEDVTAPILPSVRNNNNKQDEDFNSDCELPRKADDDFVDDEDSLPDLDSLFAKIDQTKSGVSDTNEVDGSKSNSLPKSLFGSLGSKNHVTDGAIVIKPSNKTQVDVLQTGKTLQEIAASCSYQGAKPEVKTVVDSPVKSIADDLASSRLLEGSSPRKPCYTQTAVKIESVPVRKWDSVSSTSGTAKSPLKLFRHEIEDRTNKLKDVLSNLKEEYSTMMKYTLARKSNQGASVQSSNTAQASNEIASGAPSATCVEVKGLVYYSAMRQSSQGFLPGRLRLESLGLSWKASVFLDGKQEADLLFMLEHRSIKSLIDWNEGLVLELESGSMVKLIIDPPQAFQLKIVNKVLSRIKNGKYAAGHPSSSTTASAGHSGAEEKHVTPNTNLSNSFGFNPGSQTQAPVINPGGMIHQTNHFGPLVNIPRPPTTPVLTTPRYPFLDMNNSHPHRPEPTVLPYPRPPAVTIPPPAPPVVNNRPPNPPPVLNNRQPNPPLPGFNNPPAPKPPLPVVDNYLPLNPPPPPVVDYPHAPPRVLDNPTSHNPRPPPVIQYPTPPPSAPVINIPSSPTPPLEQPAVKTAEQQLDEWKLEVLQLFPQVELGFLEGRLRAHYGHYAVNNVCSELLEMPDYPRSRTEPAETVDKPPPKEESVDYYKDYDKVTLSTQDTNCSLALLKEEFRRVSARDINDVWSTFQGHYAPAYQALEEAMKNAYAKKDQSTGTSTSRMSHSVKQINIKMKHNNKEKVIVSQLLKCGRQKRSLPYMSLLVNKEVQFVKKRKAEQKEKEDYEMAWKLNEEQYEEDGQTIECGCCFCEYSFESMVQCTEGHLFCTTCLLSYAKEAVFGSGKLNLSCMTDGCEATYPQSEMKRAVPSEILCQYEDRVREENLNLADLSDLVRCPHCNYAAIMDVEGDKVFRCQNKECMKETCRLCKENWADHIGLPCEKVEKKDETKLRKEYEEKMTEAKVRTCHRCKSKFMKEEGCNKMTCTCRATMCYICRAPNIDYNHFCRHPRDPGKLCTECTACSLWTNPDEDDKRAIEEIRKEAQEKRKEKGFEDDKTIGAPTEPPAKKHRRR